MTSTPRQLSLFDPEFSERIRHETQDGVVKFSLVDLMGEFSDTETESRYYWRDTKKRLAEQGFELVDKISQLKMLSPDGKKRKTDCADAQTCLRIIQSIPSPKAEPIRMWLASLAVERLEEYRTPGLGTQRAKERDLARLKELGYSQTDALKQLEVRVDVMASYKSLMATVKQVCDKPRYYDVANAEYFAMFGEITSGLKAILNTDSVRDAMPALQLAYIRTAELTLDQLLKQQDHMTMQEIFDCIDEIVAPLGSHLRFICDRLGIHHITGQALITTGAQ